eukprot:COSAG01_NODE_14471_length_1450_cov_1.103627_3_plen_137_part_00
MTPIRLCSEWSTENLKKILPMIYLLFKKKGRSFIRELENTHTHTPIHSGGLAGEEEEEQRQEEEVVLLCVWECLWLWEWPACCRVSRAVAPHITSSSRAEALEVCAHTSINYSRVLAGRDRVVPSLSGGPAMDSYG